MARAHHVPVMVEEVVEALILHLHGCYVDATFGRGGHTRAILARLGDGAEVLVLDRDPDAVAVAHELAKQDSRVMVEQATFSELSNLVEKRGRKAKVNGIVLDLGVSSPQLDDASRGFAFAEDGPLDMRMTPGEGESAGQWLATVDVDTLQDVLRRFGEERYARRIATAVVEARRNGPLTRTQQLAAIVSEAVPKTRASKSRDSRMLHPATRTFQAIRIFVNRELEHLENVLQQSLEVLAPQGRLVVVSFHSLEDRIVKQFIRRESGVDPHPRKMPIEGAKPSGRLKSIGKLIRPSDAEVRANPRARSARLRVAERIVGTGR